MLQRAVAGVVRRTLRLADSPAKLFARGEALFRLAGFRERRQAARRLPARIAILRLDRMGDLALCSSLLADVRRIWPGARITLIVREQLAELARLCPSVDHVVGVPVEEGVMVSDPASGNYGRWSEQTFRWLEACWRGGLWRCRFDLALIPRWGQDLYGAVALAYLTGAKERWGVSESVGPEKGVLNRDFDRLLTRAVAGPCDRHEVLLNQAFLRGLDLDAASPRLVAWVNPESRERAASLLAFAGVDLARPVIALCMGAGHRHRMWPVERYAGLSRSVFDLDRVQIVAIGNGEEARLGQRLRALLGAAVIPMEGKVPLDLLPAALERCSLYVGSNTGIMHLAAAADLPVLAIVCHPQDGDAFHADGPLRFGPWGVPSRIVQPQTPTAPCTRHCMADEPHCILGVSVDQAVSELRSLSTESDKVRACLGPALCSP